MTDAQRIELVETMHRSRLLALDRLDHFDRNRSARFLAVVTRLKWLQGRTARTAHWRPDRRGLGGLAQSFVQRRRWKRRSDRLEGAADDFRRR